jgi:hypothetical protein
VEDSVNDFKFNVFFSPPTLCPTSQDKYTNKMQKQTLIKTPT